MGITNRLPHFDLHQSGTYNNLGSMGCMFDNLIRRDPRDGGKTIIPDLAHSWEIAKDRKTYTFFLRKGVQFHDGAELTAEDVKATFDRIVKPPQGISIPRSILFRAVSEINARDKYTDRVQAGRARPPDFIMSAIASGWNVIVRKKTLEDNNYNLRKVLTIPGTGPFKTVRRVENEIWVVEKNKDYWNKGLPYLDGIEFYNLVPFSPELGSGILSGRVDYGRVTDPVTFKEGAGDQGHDGRPFNQSVIQATWSIPRSSRWPTRACVAPCTWRWIGRRPDRGDQGRGADADRRLHVSVLRSRHAEGGTGQAARLSGRSAAAEKEAKALMAAAGHPNGIKGLDYLIRDVASYQCGRRRSRRCCSRR